MTTMPTPEEIKNQWRNWAIKYNSEAEYNFSLKKKDRN
jgi:hypothetical protein